jgi:hypothetical protein
MDNSAFTDKFIRDGPADSMGSAGNDCNLFLKHHSCSSNHSFLSFNYT